MLGILKYTAHIIVAAQNVTCSPHIVAKPLVGVTFWKCIDHYLSTHSQPASGQGASLGGVQSPLNLIQCLAQPLCVAKPSDYAASFTHLTERADPKDCWVADLVQTTHLILCQQRQNDLAGLCILRIYPRLLTRAKGGGTLGTATNGCI